MMVAQKKCLVAAESRFSRRPRVMATIMRIVLPTTMSVASENKDVVFMLWVSDLPLWFRPRSAPDESVSPWLRGLRLKDLSRRSPGVRP